VDGQDVVQRVYDASYQRLVVQMVAASGDVGEAEDAVQEAFVKAISLGSRFSRLDNPEAWLRTVALNHLRNRWRHLAVVRRLGVRVPGPLAPPDVDGAGVDLADAVGQLSPDLRVVVMLRYIADLPTARIADELNLAEGTVKSRLSRARALLSDLLDDREESRHA
jgi:RNA polymerase sigma-70 factor (ECF subfamily)